MASTEDCKNLLDASLDVPHPGPFRRLSKKKTSDGVERIFASSDYTCFVRMLEAPDGSLRVDRVGATLQDVAPSASEVASAPKPARSAKPKAQPAFHAVELDQALQAKLAAAVKDWCLPHDSSDYGKFEALVKLCKEHPLAALNQFIFAVSLNPDDDLFVEVVPRALWEQDKSCFDFELPVMDILPGDEAESPNDSSTVLLHGLDDAQSQVVALLGAGVEWSAELQSALNQMLKIEQESAAEFFAWM